MANEDHFHNMREFKNFLCKDCKWHEICNQFDYLPVVDKDGVCKTSKYHEHESCHHD